MRILSTLSTNSRGTYRNIAKEVALSKDAVKNRIEKLIASKVIAKFRTTVDLSEFKLKKYDVLFRFSDERELLKTIHFLEKEHRVTWIGRLFGTYDLRITYVAKDYNELYEVMSKLNINAEMTICKIEKQQKKERIQLNEMLLGVPSKQQKKSQGAKIPHTMDKIDREIINHLTNNARMQNSDIAKKLKITQDIVHYRIKKMEKGKFIQRYTTDLDTSKLGKTWCIALIRTKNVDEATMRKLNTFVGTKQVSTYAILTGEWNLSIAFFGNNMQEIYDIFKEIRSQLADNIIRVEPLIITERYFKEQRLL